MAQPDSAFKAMVIVQPRCKRDHAFARAQPDTTSPVRLRRYQVALSVYLGSCAAAATQARHVPS
eukprot:COSAG02_NODE_5957_length_3913_cov_50.745674_2_plen_64_part_00